ncbi:hypothetical protein [Pseudoxanthomonas indica]|uniref:Uncharacterized protein n=1 Tax=Pseudoxanthomonas indica TaxID=428993 RepID=A0A1T5LSF8_9GAMM|nr:hypothetical protein [Pseudoxanthomonas indica]GGD38915.1 hypothetical protein GCM10007235_08800 [Pseudoxanthomonas indica]SKC78860.1 hypothetical protein SAMN06296058_3001 [Pseudoxanthomonas indica]
MASLNPTSTTPTPSTDSAIHFLPPAPPAPRAPPSPPIGESPRESARQQLWTVQETLHLLHLLTLSRNDDPIVAPEAWSGCLHLLSTQLATALEATEEFETA